MSIADQNSPPLQRDGATGAGHDQPREDELVELAIQLLDSTGIADDLPASMRLIEHIAECAGYRRAQQSASTKVTELMLMAARASSLADDFREDL